MPELNMEVDLKEFNKLLKDAGRLLDRSMYKTAKYLEGEITEESPVDTGLLQGRWRTAKLLNYDYKVYSNVAYAMEVHEGSKPKTVPFDHIKLWARRKGIAHLAGPIWYKIKMEGTEPNPYTEKPIQRTKKRVSEFVRLTQMEMGL